jgi:hypothetical protein
LISDFTIEKQRDGKLGITTNDGGLKVEYDGRYNVYVTVDGRYWGKTRGLCGTYNGKKGDDFTKYDGATTTSIQEFATSWKVNKQCPDLRPPSGEPCDNATTKKKKMAKTFCDSLKKEPFTICKDRVEVNSFIHDCKYDYCACESGRFACVCEALDFYATECAMKMGKPLDWKTNKIQFMECNNCKFHQFQLSFTLSFAQFLIG